MTSKEPKEKHSIYIRLIVFAGVAFGFCAAECKESVVETKTKLKKIKLIDKAYLMEFSANNSQKKNLIEKASILINGVSLTISKVTKNGFEVWIIPHTYKLTNLSKLKKNSLVNIEIDILSKYVKKYFNEQ